MKSLIGVLMGVVVVVLVFSCATVPKEPLAPGEVRLLSMDIVGSSIEAYVSFPVRVFF